ncbi:FAD-binding protein [Streptomyces sp. SCUT-3]|uniref:FAD-dependent monooxygenase n=1 Tax=Streptomyces sp. SCUT-3 TaxID=2684469 RepID=UPI0015F84865|nr:FAD-dependent monooxygenase [Streptomyces sp. SCUT-3]QMV21309.1 FAD-binding protein [Streptomyces sp. SCUT-3]
MAPEPEHGTPRRTAARPPPPAAEAAADRGDVDVLVVGAGPTGLTAACEALRHGLTVRIVDRRPGRSAFSRALVLHARTLEVLDTTGVADRLLAEGTRIAALNAGGGRGGGRCRRPARRPARIDLLDLPWGDTDHPFWLSVPQYATERVLEERLGELGGAVEWQVSFDALRARADPADPAGPDHPVEAVLVHADGAAETVVPRRLVGCDGGRSRVRESAGLRLDRSASGATFVLADVGTTAPLPEDEGHVFLGPEGLLLIVPVPEPGRWRIIAHLPGASPDRPVTVDEPFLDELVRRRAGIDFGSHDVVWTSQFDLAHGLADRYRAGPVLLAGDAAHVHSPVGGQGLNTGVQDAHDLLWRIAAARRAGSARAADLLLDGYGTERRAVARAMVRGTTRATAVLTARGAAVRGLLGAVAPVLLALPAVRARLGRDVGMLETAYPDNPPAVLAGSSGAAGRRMPDPLLRGGGRLHRLLDPLGFTWVVRGRPGEAPPDPAAPRWAGVRVVLLPDDALAERLRLPAGTGRVLLVRPDRCVAAEGATAESVRAEAVARSGLPEAVLDRIWRAPA